MSRRVRESLSSFEFAALVFAPFAAGHFLSYVLRSINAILSPYLAADLTLNAGQIGVLTSTYFLSFAIAQLPVGIALDRFGPARVQVVLLMVAALGCFIFAMSDGFASSVVARGLMGLGLAACFMGSLKAVSDWLPSSRMPSMNGYLLAIGGLGAIAATMPAQLLIDTIGWRGMFVGIALMIIAAAIVIGFAAPEPTSRARRAAPTFKSLLEVYADPAFRRTISIALVPHTVFFAVQGLWLASWLKDVADLRPSQVASYLLMGTAAMTVSTILVGKIAEHLASFGYKALDIAAVGLWGFAFIQALLIFSDQYALFIAIGFPVLGAFAGLEFAIVAQSVPPSMTGRASTCLNLLVFTGSFVVQAGFGSILAFWSPTPEGSYPHVAYQVAFGIILALQLPGLIAWAVGLIRRLILARHSSPIAK
ncbi:MFS transporter [Methylorubrum thiocyanatum]|uniref:MFS transporter n=1 Tax=Methylorubrum thiocyanatum TaxID=47958 RepID=UPI003F7D1565